MYAGSWQSYNQKPPPDSVACRLSSFTVCEKKLPKSYSVETKKESTVVECLCFFFYLASDKAAETNQNTARSLSENESKKQTFHP